MSDPCSTIPITLGLCFIAEMYVRNRDRKDTNKDVELESVNKGKIDIRVFTIDNSRERSLFSDFEDDEDAE